MPGQQAASSSGKINGRLDSFTHCSLKRVEPAAPLNGPQTEPRRERLEGESDALPAQSAMSAAHKSTYFSLPVVQVNVFVLVH